MQQTLTLCNRQHFHVHLIAGVLRATDQKQWMLLGLRTVYFFHSKAGCHAISHGQELHTWEDIIRKKHIHKRISL